MTITTARHRAFLRCFSVPLLALTACGAPSDDDAAPEVCASEGEHIVVTSRLLFARTTDGVSEGFDLDGAVTHVGDPTGCGVADDVAADGTPGIDNAFARVVPALELTEARSLEEIILEAVNAGRLLLMMRLSGVDDLVDDACVDLEILGGLGAPKVGGRGFLVPHQTFERDDAIPATTVGDATITDGVLDAGPFPFRIPVSVLNIDFDIEVLDAHVRLTFDEQGGFHGLLGGGVDLATLLAQINEASTAAYAVVGPLLESLADLSPDETGACTRLSITLEIDGVPAFLFGELPDTGGAP